MLRKQSVRGLINITIIGKERVWPLVSCLIPISFPPDVLLLQETNSQSLIVIQNQVLFNS